jgi:SAM-dependent methyltransferase
MMLTGSSGSDIQRRQIDFRMRLIESWAISAGARILEIGCGQGDMTIALANAVGEDGHVTAIDIADENYGAPSTIGESTKRVATGPLGRRIDFRLGFDILSPEKRFETNQFDVAVLSHSMWYFASVEAVLETPATIQPWSSGLCLAEWRLAPTAIDQLGHLLSVLIQGQVELLKSDSESNIRSPFSLEQLQDALPSAGWHVRSTEVLESSGMDDGQWEISHCLSHSLADAESAGATPKTLRSIASQLDLLRSVTVDRTAHSLPSYVLTAARFP